MLNENALVPLCLYGKYSDSWKMKNCKLFKRSFTRTGIGYTFNNLKNNVLFRDSKTGDLFFTNKDKNPVKMKSASSNEGLYVILEANNEEIERFEKTKKRKPTEVKVTLHNPSEPANSLIGSKTFNIPLGLSSFFSTPASIIFILLTLKLM